MVCEKSKKVESDIFQNTSSGRETSCFTAKELDDETGLYYYGARYLNPRTSRWISSDPSGADLINPMENGEQKERFNFIESQNWYSYVNNNPINYTDPTGKEAATVIVGSIVLGGLALLATAGFEPAQDAAAELADTAGDAIKQSTEKIKANIAKIGIVLKVIDNLLNPEDAIPNSDEMGLDMPGRHPGINAGKDAETKNRQDTKKDVITPPPKLPDPEDPDHKPKKPFLSKLMDLLGNQIGDSANQ